MNSSLHKELTELKIEFQNWENIKYNYEYEQGKELSKYAEEYEMELKKIEERQQKKEERKEKVKNFFKRRKNNEL